MGGMDIVTVIGSDEKIAQNALTEYLMNHPGREIVTIAADGADSMHPFARREIKVFWREDRKTEQNRDDIIEEGGEELMNDEKKKLEKVVVALKTGEVQVVKKVSRWYIESDEDDVPRLLMLWLKSGECMMINFDCLMYVSTVDFVKKGGWECGDPDGGRDQTAGGGWEDQHIGI